jgi:hypothetical protein
VLGPRTLTDPLLRLAAGPAAALLGADAAEEGKIERGHLFKPHARSRRHAWTHYGVMIPDLPEPHRFLACTSLIGATGSLIFDTDHARVDSPRQTATLVNGTAATAPGFFGAYSIGRDMELADDGTLVRFGKDLELSGRHPAFRLRGSREGFAFDLDIACSDAVTFFLRGPIWEHLSILARYEGRIATGATHLDVSGTCTFEYGACAVGPHLLADVPLPPSLKIAGDFFTYQVVALAPGRQLLLTRVCVAGSAVLRAAYIRGSDGESRRLVHGVGFEVLEYAEHPAIAPDGRRMRLPLRFRWTAPGLWLTGEVDTPMLYGLGSGYVGGYAYAGELDGEQIAGRAYIEYVDRTQG